MTRLTRQEVLVKRYELLGNLHADVVGEPVVMEQCSPGGLPVFTPWSQWIPGTEFGWDIMYIFRPRECKTT